MSHSEENQEPAPMLLSMCECMHVCMRVNTRVLFSGDCTDFVSPGFDMGTRDLNSGSHAWKAGTLLTVPFP